jgi:hypothetical protein
MAGENGPGEPETRAISRAFRTVPTCRAKKNRQQPSFICLPRKQVNCSAFP